MTNTVAYSVREAASAAGCSTDTIMRAIHRTDAQALPAKRLGAKYLIKRSALEQWINNLPDA